MQPDFVLDLVAIQDGQRVAVGNLDDLAGEFVKIRRAGSDQNEGERQQFGQHGRMVAETAQRVNNVRPYTYRKTQNGQLKPPSLAD
jgi:hypothetical protein